jgi:hypothetical protein
MKSYTYGIWSSLGSVFIPVAAPSQGRFGSLVGGELSWLVSVLPVELTIYTLTLRMKTEMVFETSVSTKAEPHYPAENPKELLH